MTSVGEHFGKRLADAYNRDLDQKILSSFVKPNPSDIPPPRGVIAREDHLQDNLSPRGAPKAPSHEIPAGDPAGRDQAKKPDESRPLQK